MRIRASAPGKLVLIGEYGVLRGGPALVAAVDRRAEVSLEPGAAGIRVTAPQLGLEGTPVEADPRLRLAAACLDGFSGEVCIDTGALHQDGHKLGLGSSAAVCVALCAARGDEDCRRALRIHRQV